jgi:murein L,D-transpeptidase YafK
LRLLQIASFFVKGCLFGVAAVSVGSCSLDDIDTMVKMGTVRPSTLEQMDRLDMDRSAPILIRIFKEESTLEVWKENRTGTFALLKTYPICKFSGKLGPKITEGDRQAPEGFYEVTRDQMNPLSHEYLAFNVGFPNAFDRSLHRTGSLVMVHGGCASIGCYAMTDYEMSEIYALLDEAFASGQDKVQLQAFPFRMTYQNLSRHAQDRNAPFWQMLKAGSDAFLATRQPPNVAVCDLRYVFNPLTEEDLDPSAPCPLGVGQDLLAGEEQSPPKSLGIVEWSGRLALADQSADRIASKTKGKSRARLVMSSHLTSRHLALCHLKRDIHERCHSTSSVQARQEKSSVHRRS